MLTEEEVYNGTKNWLINNGFSVLAGQPPRGDDHLPVIEIKKTLGRKGSFNSYKPDLVAYKDEKFFVIECKPKYDYGDDVKLHNILSSKDRWVSLYKELQQYKLLSKVEYNQSYDVFAVNVDVIIANSEGYNSECELKQLIVNSWLGDATIY